MADILGIGVSHRQAFNRIDLPVVEHAQSRHARVVDRVESYVFNSSKCFALFSP